MRRRMAIWDVTERPDKNGAVRTSPNRCEPLLIFGRTGDGVCAAVIAGEPGGYCGALAASIAKSVLRFVMYNTPLATTGVV